MLLEYYIYSDKTIVISVCMKYCNTPNSGQY